MAGIRIEGSTEVEVRSIAVQMGVEVTRVFAKRRGQGFFGYGQVVLDGSKRIQVTQEQIDVIANVFKYAADHAALEHAKAVYEESQIIDVEFKVSTND